MRLIVAQNLKTNEIETNVNLTMIKIVKNMGYNNAFVNNQQTFLCHFYLAIADFPNNNHDLYRKRQFLTKQ